MSEIHTLILLILTYVGAMKSSLLIRHYAELDGDCGVLGTLMMHTGFNMRYADIATLRAEADIMKK